MPRTFIILFLVTGSCFAQDSIRFDKLIPRTALKFAPATLLNFYPTLEFSFEQKIVKRFSVQIGYGHVIKIDKSFDSEYQNKKGYKTNLEIHYYLMPSRKYNLVYYIASGGYINAVDFYRETSQQECYDLSCNHTFTRYYNYTVNYREHGFTLKFGFVKHFPKSIFIDVNGGWSFRYIDYDQPLIPPGMNNFVMDESFLFGNIPIEDDWFTLTPLVGFRVGYRFR